MSNQLLEPLELNKESGEPFLRLSFPHENIIITPPRISDVDRMVIILNDPSVRPWMGMPVTSFERPNVEAWVEKLKAESDTLLLALQKPEDGEQLKLADGCPIRSLREVQQDGTELYVGDVGIKRCTWTEVLDKEEKQRLIDANASKAVGDPEIVWQIADFLATSHHRRGIMTMALTELLRKWAIPRMGVHHIRLVVFEGNQGSVGVFKKVGFVEVNTDNNDILVVRGEKRPLIILEWNTA